jgi:hypothetical protein
VATSGQAMQRECEFQVGAGELEEAVQVLEAEHGVSWGLDDDRFIGAWS